VAVTGDVRTDLYRHLTGHAPGFFADRLPGTLSSRITAASNAVFAIENMGMWNVLPPIAATAGAIALLATVSPAMTLGLAAAAAVLIGVMFRLARAGGPLHDRFARRAAAIDGEMVDVIGNIQLVRVFGGIRREHRRFERERHPCTLHPVPVMVTDPANHVTVTLVADFPPRLPC